MVSKSSSATLKNETFGAACPEFISGPVAATEMAIWFFLFEEGLYFLCASPCSPFLCGFFFYFTRSRKVAKRGVRSVFINPGAAALNLDRMNMMNRIFVCEEPNPSHPVLPVNPVCLSF